MISGRGGRMLASMAGIVASVIGWGKDMINVGKASVPDFGLDDIPRYEEHERNKQRSRTMRSRDWQKSKKRRKMAHKSRMINHFVAKRG